MKVDHTTLFVKDLFNRVSSKYDLMNDLMSGGLHRLWKDKLVSLIPQIPNLYLLDVAGGTGDISFKFLKQCTFLDPSVTIVDLSPEMIKQGQDKAINENILQNLSWVCGSGEELPFPDDSFDVCTISFGLRNIMDKEKALAEMYRVLKPGGTFLCLEFSHPDPLFQSLYKAYSFGVIPKLGKWVANDQAAYDYLVQSIRQFPTQEILLKMIAQAGFKKGTYMNLSKGIAAIHRGWK